MSRKTLRYKKPEWIDWVYITVDAGELDKWVSTLKDEGYQVQVT